MKIFLFFLQHSNILRRISTSENKIESFFERFRRITCNLFRQEKKLISQSVVTRKEEKVQQNTNSSTIEDSSRNINSLSSIYSTSTDNTHISPMTTRSNDIASTICNTQNISNTSTSMYCPDYPPFNIIYNIFEETCWIITIMHNIRANFALKNYILRHLRNEDIKEGIESVLKINGAPINKKQHNQITQLYAPCTDLWKQCGYQSLFLESLLEETGSSQDFPNPCKLSNKDYLFEKVYTGPKCIYKMKRNLKMPYLPYFYLKPTTLFTCLNYFNVSGIFLNDHVNLNELIENYHNSGYLESFPGFLVLDLFGFRNLVNNRVCTKAKGVTFEKYIYIDDKDKLNKQKYSLTGISFEEERNGIYHARAVIKINDKWYDTDSETEKYFKKNTGQCYTPPIKLVDNLNNNANKIIVDYSSGDGRKLFVCLLFYEKIDYMQTKKTFLKH